jgi:hypothetical protein
MVALLRHFKVIGAFLIVLVFNSVVSWAQTNTWQAAVGATPSATLQRPFDHPITIKTLTLAGELFFLQLLILNGMSRGFCEAAGLMNMKKQTVPRVRWMYLWCAACTVFCGFFGGPPIVISPECGAGILAGARTGLSAVVAGILFGFVPFFSPMLKELPPAAIAPLLMSLGVVSMANAKKIDFMEYKVAWPAFIVLFLIPFAFNIVDGVIYGWLIYLILHLFSGDLYRSAKQIIGFYSEALMLNLFDNWLDKYVPAYWLVVPPPPPGPPGPGGPPPPIPAAVSVASDGPSSIRPSSFKSATVISTTTSELQQSAASTETQSTVVTTDSDKDQLSRKSQAARMSTFRSSQSLQRRDNGSYVVDWKGIRKSLWSDFFIDEDAENENENNESNIELGPSVRSGEETEMDLYSNEPSVGRASQVNGYHPNNGAGRLTMQPPPHQYGAYHSDEYGGRDIRSPSHDVRATWC